MAFTLLSQIAPGTVVTAGAHWNPIIDDLVYIYNNTQGLAYTPTWASTGTQPAIGNGVLTGTYGRIGKLVVFNFICSMGSTTTFGTGDYSFALPVTADAAAVGVAIFKAWVFDSGTNYYEGSGRMADATKLYINTHLMGTGTSISATVPITFAVNDQIRVSGSYIASTN
jgi:hypothetical protein